MRNHSIVLGFVAAAGLAGCGGGGAAKALAMLPSETQLVVGLDIAKARGTALWEAGQDLMKSLAKDDGSKAAFEKFEEELKAFEKKTGLDLANDLERVVGGFSLEGDKSLAVIFTTKAKLDEDALVDYFEDEAEEDGNSLEKETVKDVTIWRTVGGKSSAFFWDDKTMVVGSHDWIESMAELKGGKGKSAAENKALVGALAKVDGAAAAWFAGGMTDELEAVSKGSPVKGLDDAIDMAGSVILKKGIEAIVKIGFKKKEDAADVAEALAKSAKDGKKLVKAMADDVPWAKDLLEGYSIEAVGADAVVTVRVSEDTLGEAVKWFKKDGKGMLPGLLGGAGPGLGARKVSAAGAGASLASVVAPSRSATPTTPGMGAGPGTFAGARGGLGAAGISRPVETLDCSGPIRTSDIPDAPLWGEVRGRPFRAEDGALVVKDGLIDLYLLSGRYETTCSPDAMRGTELGVFLTGGEPGSYAGPAGIEMYDIKAAGSEHADYTEATVIRAAVVIDEASLRPGRTATGKVALCYGDGSWVAGRFSVPTCE